MIRFLRWFCREELGETLEGDILVIYKERRSRMPRIVANIFIFLTILTFLQPFAVRKGKLNPLSNFKNMYLNHFKIGFRLIGRHFTYSFINILGLAIGLSAVLLIAIFINNEFSYDKFHSKGNDIVRVTYKLETPNVTREGAKLPFPIKAVLNTEYPEVQKTARFYYWSGDTPLLSYENSKHTEDGIYFAENDIFELFDFEFVSGNQSTALSDPRSIILTEKLAAKYFGDQDPIGQVMQYKNEDNLTVTAVLKNLPDNSHIVFDALLPIELQRQRWLGWGKSTYDLEKDWNWAAAWTYILLVPDTDRGAFEKKLQQIANTYLNTDEQDGFSLQIQPLFNIHLKSDKSAEPRANGNMTLIYGFGMIAIFILIIACINFLNLTSAQANERLKEIGVRKIMGAGKGNLIAQFIVESVILVVMATTLALVISFLTLPLFNEFMNKSLSMDLNNLPLIIICLGVAFSMALLSGLRPTIAIMAISSGQKFNLSKSKRRYSMAMVVGQFLICNLLFTGILVIHKQLDLLRNKDLGFDKEQMLILRHAKNLSKDQFEVFQNELESIPNVESLHRGYVAGTRSYTNTFKIVDSDDNDTYSLGIKWIGDGFTDMFDLELIEGNNFNENIDSDISSGILINESAAKALGWSTEESIGKRLSFLPGGADKPQTIVVIGVLADANFESLYDPVLPSVFRRPRSNVGGDVTLKLLSSNDLLKTLDAIEMAWKSAIPEWPFEFSFLDERIDAQYLKEERLANAIGYFTILAILIACSGLFGLASFAIQQRTKEIGVRKVLGASLGSIFTLISRHFVLLVSISFCLSIPIGYFLFGKWLEDFAYRISIDPYIFIIGGITSTILVVIAVGSQSLKAANSDPVKTLRYE